MEQFNREFINTICDLKEETDGVEVLQTYTKLLDELMKEMSKTQVSSLYFGDVDQLKDYLKHFLERMKHTEKLKLEDSKHRVIKCDCGCIWNLFVKPDNPEYGYSPFDGTFPMESLMERALLFMCSICERVSVVRSASRIFKIESEHIPPHVAIRQ